MQQLNINGREVSPHEIITLLADHRLLPSLVRELIIDEAIAPFPCTPSDVNARAHSIFAQSGISDAAQPEWMLQQGFKDKTHFLQWVERQIKLEQFKQQTWKAKLESYFLVRKDDLDQVIYSFIRVSDEGVALELYCRLVEDKEPFQDLAKQYSEGFERSTGGMIGPCPLSKPHPDVKQLLLSLAPGDICYPTQIGEWWVILRLEQLLPAQFDADVQQRLLDDLFEDWLQQQVEAYSVCSVEKTDINLNVRK